MRIKIINRSLKGPTSYDPTVSEAFSYIEQSWLELWPAWASGAFNGPLRDGKLLSLRTYAGGISNGYYRNHIGNLSAFSRQGKLF
jgi:hypothetical protein